MIDKITFTRTLDAYAAKAGELRLVDVPDLQYLCIDGHGDPNTSVDFAQGTAALYPLAYALKFASKRDLGRDYVVPPLEGLWWADDMAAFTSQRDKSRWHFTLMIMTPEWIDQAMFAAAVEAVTRKGAPARLGEVRLETLSEGRCVQTLHVGAFDDEAGVLALMHEQFIPSHGLTMTGRHHEIYLSDARRLAP